MRDTSPSCLAFGRNVDVFEGCHAVEELDDRDSHPVVVQHIGELDTDGVGARPR
jgi:hypothetical protein